MGVTRVGIAWAQFRIQDVRDDLGWTKQTVIILPVSRYILWPSQRMLSNEIFYRFSIRVRHTQSTSPCDQDEWLEHLAANRSSQSL